MNNQQTNSMPILGSFLSLIILFAGCGKHESTGGAIGATGGGLIGHAVAGKNSKVAGTLIGGLLGGIVGSSIGKSADEEEEIENTIKEQERRERRHEVEYLKEENERLRRNLIKWCSNCGRRCELVGAHSCASCGAPLIHEKFCKDCKTVFNPQSGYKYCPYCKDHVLLSCR